MMSVQTSATQRRTSSIWIKKTAKLKKIQQRIEILKEKRNIGNENLNESNIKIKQTKKGEKID